MEVIFYITLFMYLFIFGGLTDFADYDFFARLIVGKTFFQTGEILKYDFLSYGPTHPWYDHEWGSSVIFYFIYEHFSDIGLFILKTLCIFLAFFFFVQIIKLRRKNLHKNEIFPIFNFLFFFIMIQPLENMIFSLRCHHFTFLFFGMWLYILEKSRLENNYKILWMLPLIMLVWSNIHGGCFVGLGVLGLYIIGEFLSKKPYMPYIYSFLASVLIMFANPYGKDYVIFLFKAATMQRHQIYEWQSPFSDHHIRGFIRYKIVLFGFCILTMFQFIKTVLSVNKNSFAEKIKNIWNNTDKTKFLIILFMFLLSIKSVRFITYFVFVLIPFCYDDFYSIFNKKMKPFINNLKELIIFGIVLMTFSLNVIAKDFKYKNDYAIFPSSEIQFLIDNNIKGNIFAPFETGSYAAYKLYPNNFILMDGRYEEVYPVELNDTYARIITLGAVGWKEKLDEIHHDIIITYLNMPMYNNLQGLNSYVEVLKSDKFALFIKKDIFDKIKKPVKIPMDDYEFYKRTLFDTNINWKKQ